MRRVLSTKILVSALIFSSLQIITSAAHAACDKTQLHDNMESMKKAFKAMRGAANDGDWLTISSSRAKMQELASASGKEQPLKLEEIAPGEKPRFLQDYRHGMEDLELKLDQLAAAETGKDIETARSIVEDIGKHSKKSHKSFKMDCD